MGVTKIRSVSARKSKRRSWFPRISFLPKLTFLSVPSKRSRWPLLAALLIILIAIPAAIFLNSRAKPVAATWWNASWQFRQRVDITNASGSTLTDFQVSFTLDTATLITASKIQVNCQDIRVTDHQGNELPFWIETAYKKCNTDSTKIWLKAPIIPTTGATFFVYYGNSSATTSQNHDGEKVFEYFEGFEAYPTDSNINGQGSWVVNNGTWTIASDPSNANNKVLSADTGGSGWLQQAIQDNSFTTHNNIFLEADFYIDGAYNMYTSDPLMWIGFRNTSPTTYLAPGWGGWSKYHVIAAKPTSQFASEGAIASIPTSQWIPFKVSASGTSITSYLIEGGTIAYNSSAQTTGTFLAIDVRAFKGYWDNFRSRKYAVTEPTASLASEETTPGPVISLKFEEASGNTAINEAGINNGTIAGSTSRANEEMCVSGKCLEFHNDNASKITLPDNNSYDFGTSSFTVSGWAKHRSGSWPRSNFMVKKSNTCYVSGSANAGFDIGHGYVSTGADICFHDTDNNYLRQSLVFDDGFRPAQNVNKWVHYTFIFDRTEHRVKVYINGVKQTNEVDISSVPGSINNSALFSIGGNMYGWTIDGWIDDVLVYPYIRTEQQIKTDFNRGSSVLIGAPEQGTLSNGLIGYWKMDETSWSGVNSEVVDSSGNQAHGTTGNGTTVGGGKYGRAGNFDGIDDEIQVSSFQNLDLGMTFSAWVNPANNTATKVAIAGTTYSVQLSLTADGNRISLNARNSAGTWFQEPSGSAVVAPADQWSHIAGVITQQGEMKIYLNGESICSGACNIIDSLYTTSGLYIGRNSGTTNNFAGKIDEARVYNRALSDSEIRNLYYFAPGPLAHFKLDEGTGSTANDSSGNGNTGTLINSPTWVNGKFGKALEFTGSGSDYIDVANEANFDFSNNFTVGFWINADSNNPDGYLGILGKYQSDQTGWDLGMQLGRIRSTVRGSSMIDTSTSVSVNLRDNNWHYVSVVVTPTSIKTYIDGVQKGNSTGTWTPVLNDARVFLGKRTSTTGFNGKLDDIKFYNYARTSQQIVQDMNAGHPTGGSPVGSQLAYWKLDEGNGSIAHDAGPNGYNGALGGTVLPQWTNPGKVNQSIFFTAASDTGGSRIVVSPINLSSTLGTTMTISAWIKPSPTQTNSRAFFVRNGHGGDENYGLDLSAPSGGLYKLNFTYNDGSNFRTLQSTNPFVPADTWSHLGVVITQGTSVQFFLNGSPIQTINWSGNPSVQSTTALYLGGHLGASAQSFDGFLDEIKIYSSALTADQIKLDYNLGVSSSYGGSTVNEGDNLADGAGAPPVAEYHFEEMTGAQAKDSSGNNRNGNITGAQWEPAGKEGAALTFDGNDYVDVGNVGASSTNFTVSAWINPSLMASQEISVITKRNGTDAGWALGINANGTSPIVIWRTFSGGNQYSISGTRQLAINNWYYITVVHQDGVASLYVNGAFDRSANITNPATDTTAMRIGYLNGGAISYRGKIDEVKIYDYTRTPAQIAYDYNRGEPVAHYKFDECEGSDIHDSSENNYHGTLSIGGTGSNTSIGTCSTSDSSWGSGSSGKYNSSLYFDGNIDMVEIPGGDLLGTVANFAISAWVKTTDTTGSIYGEFSSDGGSTRNFLVVAGGKVQFDQYSPSGGYMVSNSDVNTGEWTHVVYVQDGTNRKIYIDGKLDIEDNAAEVYSGAAPAVARIGRRGTASEVYSLNGQIDDLRLYNYTLSTTQVKHIMNEGLAIRF